MVTLVKLLQSSNALSPMEVTELGMVTLVKLLHQANARSPIVVTELGMVYDPPLPPGYCMSVRSSLSKRTPSLLVYVGFCPSTVIVVSLLHPANARSPIVVTELGMVTLVKLHHRNACSPIVVTGSPLILSGMATCADKPLYLVMITMPESSLKEKSPHPSLKPF
jgi:hypothetical protein